MTNTTRTIRGPLACLEAKGERAEKFRASIIRKLDDARRWNPEYSVTLFSLIQYLRSDDLNALSSEMMFACAEWLISSENGRYVVNLRGRWISRPIKK